MNAYSASIEITAREGVRFLLRRMRVNTIKTSSASIEMTSSRYGRFLFRRKFIHIKACNTVTEMDHEERFPVDAININICSYEKFPTFSS